MSPPEGRSGTDAWNEQWERMQRTRRDPISTARRIANEAAKIIKAAPEEAAKVLQDAKVAVEQAPEVIEHAGKALQYAFMFFTGTAAAGLAYLSPLQGEPVGNTFLTLPTPGDRAPPPTVAPPFTFTRERVNTRGIRLTPTRTPFKEPELRPLALPTPGLGPDQTYTFRGERVDTRGIRLTPDPSPFEPGPLALPAPGLGPDQTYTFRGERVDTRGIRLTPDPSPFEPGPLAALPAPGLGPDQTYTFRGERVDTRSIRLTPDPSPFEPGPFTPLALRAPGPGPDQTYTFRGERVDTRRIRLTPDPSPFEPDTLFLPAPPPRSEFSHPEVKQIRPPREQVKIDIRPPRETMTTEDKTLSNIHDDLAVIQGLKAPPSVTVSTKHTVWPSHPLIRSERCPPRPPCSGRPRACPPRQPCGTGQERQPCASRATPCGA